MIHLLADIGGTHTRCALYDDGSGALSKAQTATNAQATDLATLLGEYLAGVPADHRPRRACIAVAAPVRGDAIRMINIDWSFSLSSLRDTLRLDSIEAMNDFEALAHALPELGEQDLLPVGAGRADPDATKVVLGPGTGLGVAILSRWRDGWQPVSGEGGHASLAANNDDEAELIRFVQQRHGHCSAERVLSGAGLALIHEHLSGGEAIDAPMVARRYDAGDAIATASFELFFRLLGSVAGNLALTAGAFGGVYIGGGIVPRQPDRFARSGFRAAFESKGRYREYLQDIATLAIVAEHPTLTGLAACARQRINR